MGIEHLIPAFFHINVVDGPVRPCRTVHGILVDPIPIRHLIPFFHQKLTLLLMPVIMERLENNKCKPQQNKCNNNIVKGIHAGKNLFLRDG